MDRSLGPPSLSVSFMTPGAGLCVCECLCTRLCVCVCACMVAYKLPQCTTTNGYSVTLVIITVSHPQLFRLACLQQPQLLLGLYAPSCSCSSCLQWWQPYCYCYGGKLRQLNVMLSESTAHTVPTRVNRYSVHVSYMCCLFSARVNGEMVYKSGIVDIADLWVDQHSTRRMLQWTLFALVNTYTHILVYILPPRVLYTSE